MGLWILIVGWRRFFRGVRCGVEVRLWRLVGVHVRADSCQIWRDSHLYW